MSVIALLLLLVLIVGIPLLIGGVVAVILVSRKNKSGPQDMTSIEPALVTGDTRAQRSEILQQLADKQLTREDAEARLAALGTPVPEDMPQLPQASSGGSGKGCLIALLIALPIVLVGILVLLVLGMLTLRASSHRVITDMPMPIEQVVPSSHDIGEQR